MVMFWCLSYEISTCRIMSTIVALSPALKHYLWAVRWFLYFAFFAEVKMTESHSTRAHAVRKTFRVYLPFTRTRWCRARARALHVRCSQEFTLDTRHTIGSYAKINLKATTILILAHESLISKRRTHLVTPNSACLFEAFSNCLGN